MAVEKQGRDAVHLDGMALAEVVKHSVRSSCPFPPGQKLNEEFSTTLSRANAGRLQLLSYGHVQLALDANASLHTLLPRWLYHESAN